MKRTLFIFLVLSVTMFVLSACGSSGPSTTLNITLAEFTFAPSVFTVPAGQEITINATNNGAVVHDFVIFNLGTDAGDHFNEEDQVNVYWQIELQPGQSETTTFTAPDEPGEYSITCGIQGHLEAGMSGKLIVVAVE